MEKTDCLCPSPLVNHDTKICTLCHGYRDLLPIEVEKELSKKKRKKK